MPNAFSIILLIAALCGSFLSGTLYPGSLGDSPGNFEGEKREIALKTIEEARSQIDQMNFIITRLEVTKINKINDPDCPWEVYLKGYTYFNIPITKARIYLENHPPWWSCGGSFRPLNKEFD